jgi:hypothetical protein
VRYITLTHPTGSAIALVSLRKKKYNETIKTTFSLFGGKNMSEEKSWANVAKFVGLCAATLGALVAAGRSTPPTPPPQPPSKKSKP